MEGISELVLEVTDLAEATRFYNEVLGMPVMSVEGHRTWLQAGASRIGLWTPQVGIAKGRGGVHVHYAIRVSDADYDTMMERLRSTGDEAGQVLWEGGSRSFYVTDPDQHVVEFWTHDIRNGEAGVGAAASPGLFGMPGLPPI